MRSLREFCCLRWSVTIAWRRRFGKLVGKGRDNRASLVIRFTYKTLHLRRTALPLILQLLHLRRHPLRRLAIHKPLG